MKKEKYIVVVKNDGDMKAYSATACDPKGALAAVCEALTPGSSKAFLRRAEGTNARVINGIFRDQTGYSLSFLAPYKGVLMAGLPEVEE